MVRSSLAAETCAFTDGEDQLEFVKLFLLELLEPNPLDLRKYTQLIAECGIESPMVTDCKSLYDAIEKNMSAGLSLSEKRTAIEVIALKERMSQLNLKLFWVNGDRQLADGLTKPTAPTTYNSSCGTPNGVLPMTQTSNPQRN